MTQTDDVLDKIDRQIDIDAPAERVWDLVSRPGWWINEGEVEADAETRVEGDLTVLVHPSYGEFRLRTLAADPPRHIAYTWIDNASASPVGTRVEFWIEDRPGGVTLKVTESGFGSLQKEHAAILNHVKENTEGWEKELVAAQRFVTGATP